MDLWQDLTTLPECEVSAGPAAKAVAVHDMNHACVSGCMAALEAEHFLQEHEIQQGKSEPTPAENEALPVNGRVPREHRPV